MTITERIKLKEKVGYGFGDFSSSMFWKIFTIYLPFFYTEVFGITAAAVGSMLLVTRIWDTANDPLMGIITDRTNTKWGKFRPYLLWIAVPFGIAGVLLFTTPNFSDSGKLVYAYITYTLMMMVYTAINVPYASLLGVSTSDSNDRTTLASYRMVFAFGGSLLVVAIFQPIVDFFKISMAETRSYQMTMVVIGALAAFFFIVAFAWTRERITPPKSQKNNLKEDFKNLLHNGPWFILLGAGVMTILFNTIRDGVALYYFKYYVIDETAIRLSKMTFTFSTLYLFIGQGANMLGVIFAKPVSAKLGKKQTFVLAMVGAAAFSIFFFFIGKGNVVQIYILQVIVSFCAGIVLPLLWSMYADSADWSEWKTGRRATGLVFSASSMTQKLGWTLGGAVTLWLLAAYGFEANVDQSEETIKGIKYMLSFLPAAAALCSGIFIYFYQLSDKKMKQIAIELEDKRK